jgi:hypothetical protein
MSLNTYLCQPSLLQVVLRLHLWKVFFVCCIECLVCLSGEHTQKLLLQTPSKALCRLCKIPQHMEDNYAEREQQPLLLMDIRK